jgi:uncharacterized iron-regulated membrane protein
MTASSSSQASVFFRRGRAARLWRNIHLWLGIGLFVLLVPVALSGAILVYHDDIGDMMNTPRGAVATSAELDIAAAVANATKAAGDKFQPTAIRFPEDSRVPVSVSVRGQAARGERPAFLTVLVDRNDAHVIKVVNFRESFFGFMHIFHENLTIPNYGRSIVGWTGAAMLVLSLTGLYLWWPRHNQWARAFAWRRKPSTSSNLHHMTGFWICLPLAFLSLTGMYLAWPQQGRALLSSVAEVTPQQRGRTPVTPERSASDIYAIAKARPNADVAAIMYPTRQSNGWRVQMRDAGSSEPVTLSVNDKTGAVSVIEPLKGDRIGSWIRWLHEGSHAGEVWRFIVFLSGVMPAILGVTGIILWLRQRRQRALVHAGPARRDTVSTPLAGETTPAE